MGTTEVKNSQMNSVTAYNAKKCKITSKPAMIDELIKTVQYKPISSSRSLYFSSVFLELHSGDGDLLSLSMESIQWNKNDKISNKIIDKPNIDSVFSFAKGQLKKMQNQLLGLIEKKGVNLSEIENAENDLPIPQYWNSQNTSQRIVEFSFSFYSDFKGSDEEFSSQIKNAIDEGFKQAKQIMGKLPEAINNLVSETYDLVMEKLDCMIKQKSSEKTEIE